MTRRRVFVTGATGFVGRALVERLAGTHDLVTQRHEMAPETDWRPVLDGVDAVVHLAALAHELHGSSAPEVYHRVNVEGTRALAEQASAAGVRRFVHMSTAKVMGDGVLGPMSPWTEKDEPSPADAYGRSKLAAENVVAEVARQTGMEHVVLRPPVVYGPQLKANLLRLLVAIDKGRPLPLRAVDNLRSMVYVGNLVDVVERCLDDPRAMGETFFVSDCEDVSTRELAMRMGRHLARSALLVPVPPKVLLTGASLVGRRHDAERILASLTVDPSHLRERLGWRPPWNLDEGLAATVAWYRASQIARHP